MTSEQVRDRARVRIEEQKPMTRADLETIVDKVQDEFVEQTEDYLDFDVLMGIAGELWDEWEPKMPKPEGTGLFESSA